MSADTDSSVYYPPGKNQVASTAPNSNDMSPPYTRTKEKGKQRAVNLESLSFPTSSTNGAEHDPQTNSYLLAVPSAAGSTEVTPTANSMKSPPRPPQRSPLRSGQSSPRRRPVEPPSSGNEPATVEQSRPIPRQRTDSSAAARERRREAYKSGMSFVSLYELYSEPPLPPVPVPALPSLDRTKLVAAEQASVKRARSGSTASIGTSRERKTSVQTSATIASSHGRARSGSSAESPLRSQPHALRPSKDAPSGVADSPTSLRLGNTTISSSILTVQPTPSLAESAPTKSKRQHVLFEILETERIYSSDMALVRAVHLPLALGMKIELGPMGQVASSARSSAADGNVDIGPSRSSGISTNTASSTQSQSGSSTYPASPGHSLGNEPPMSVEDAKVIFANLDELAEFTGRFTEFIQLALGSEIEGGEGPDRIGTLFLQMLPIMAPIYETYITKHSASIARLTTLTTENPSPAMLQYIEHTKAIASTHSNSWDLNSLLIKPIQRFLKYPLLLETLVASTPDDHPDKPDLIRAKTAMVEASRLVNEQTQKVEICRTILQRKPLKGLSAVFSTGAPNSQQLKVKGSKSVFAVTKSKEPAPSTTAAAAATATTSSSPSVTPFDAVFDPIQLENRLVEHASGGAAGLEELIKHLQGFETILPRYLRDVVNWVREVRNTLTRLEKWAAAFERVISLEDNGGIEALDAFRGVLTDRLGPILDGLEIAVRSTLAPTLTKIQDSMKGPTLLLNTAASLRTVHNQMMNTPYISKTNRPSPQMIEGSKTYLALMQQLRTDLPVYVRHLDRMFGYVILQVAKWQERWYREVGHAWGDLWAALEVGPGSRREYRARRHKELTSKKGSKPSEPESSEQRRGAYGCSGDETAAIWWDRWEEVNLAIAALGVPSGGALQGVRSLQGLMKIPQSSAGSYFPQPISEPYQTPTFDGRTIPEDIKDEEFGRHPPGYYTPAVAQTAPPRRPSRPAIQTRSTTEMPMSQSLSVSSPTRSHAINSFLPAVSPGSQGKPRPTNGKTVSFLSETTSGESAESSSRVPREVNMSSSQRTRTKSHERDYATGSTRLEGAWQNNDTDRAKTLPRGTSFRRRLSENMWSGEGNEKSAPPESKGVKGGLDIDPEELEAAVATTHAREEREAELVGIGIREGVVPRPGLSSSTSAPAVNGNGPTRQLSQSTSNNALRKKRPTHTRETTTSTSMDLSSHIHVDLPPSRQNQQQTQPPPQRQYSSQQPTPFSSSSSLQVVPEYPAARPRPGYLGRTRQVVSEYSPNMRPSSSLSLLADAAGLGEPSSSKTSLNRSSAGGSRSTAAYSMASNLAGANLLSDDAPILFTCTAVANFDAGGFRYAGLPFLELEIGDVVNIVKDCGRPAQHPDLKPVVSDGIDTLFIGKRVPDGGDSPEIGWLWASFVMPLEM